MFEGMHWIKSKGKTGCDENKTHIDNVHELTHMDTHLCHMYTGACTPHPTYSEHVHHSQHTVNMYTTPNIQ